MSLPNVSSWMLALAVSAAAGGGALAAPASTESPLGPYPVCEASAALEVPCSDDGKQRCVWVGDNEQEGALFEYRIGASGELTPAPTFEIKLGGVKVGDIEALAADGDGVLAIGSHSRKNSCEPDEDRHVIARVSRVPGKTGVEAKLVATDEGWSERVTGCASTLVKLADAPPDSEIGGLRKEFCAALAASEQAADEAVSDKTKKCRGDALNIEGAVSLPDESGKPRVWIGLRGPLLGKRAVLLRLAPFSETSQRLSFDGIAAIDLGERGIRELAVSGGWLYGLAGCVADCEGASEKPSALWRVNAGDVHLGKTISGVTIINDELSSHAEGLVIRANPGRAIVIIDGDRGKKLLPNGEKRTACVAKAGQMVVALP